MCEQTSYVSNIDCVLSYHINKLSIMVGNMKSTDLNRRDREIKKSRKKEELIQKKVEGRNDQSVGEFIKRFFSLYFFD